MALPDDYLEDALAAVSLSKKRPKQSLLRRAVSTAYYALFHELVECAAASLTPTKPARLKSEVARMLSHGDMLDVCKVWSKGNAGKWQHLAPAPLPVQIKDVASAFVSLQQARHEADYDTSRRFLKAEARVHVGRAQNAIAGWRQVKSSTHANVFKVALMHKSPRN